MTLDLATLGQLVAVSGGVAVVVEGAKRAARLAVARLGITVAPELERLAVRALGVGLGVVAVGLGWGWDVVAVSVGLLAGAASEVVYRWLLSRLPDLLARVSRG